jgi:hypothetical protein
MRRLVIFALLGGVIWSVVLLEPSPSDEQQLRSLVGIAAGSAGLTQESDLSAQTSAASVPSREEIVPPKPVEAQRPLAPPSSDSHPVPSQQLATASPSSYGPPVSPIGSASPTLLLTDAKIGTAIGPAQTKGLVDRLQTELRRVGCLKSKGSGTWDYATRRAMSRFNDRIGARFSLDSPDPIFLTLVEKYDNRACGQPCLPGSLPDASGICVFPQQVASSELPMPVAAAPSGELASRDIEATSKGSDPVPAPVAATHDQKVAALALLKGQSGEPLTGNLVPAPPVPVLVAVAPDNGGADPGQPDPSSVRAPTPARIAAHALPGPGTLAKSDGVAPAGTATWAAEVSPTAPQSTTTIASLGSSDSSSSASAVAKAPLTTIAVLTPTKPVKRQRKSSGWGNTANGIGIRSPRPFYVVRRPSGGDAIAQVFRALVGGLF